jgi:hypothetical protein
MSSIYATTISSEKYIIINSQNIELSGNVIMKEHVTISNGLLNTNSIVPNVTNNASLGSTSSSWSNAYIRDLSVNNNLQVLGNVNISGNFEASNIYTKAHIDNSFTNVYTITQFDNSFANVYDRSHIDQSFQNVYTITQFDNSYANVYTSDHIDNSFQNVYNIEHIDTSFQNVYTRIQFDNSFTKVYTIKQFDNSYANVCNRDHVDLSFGNVYNREHVDNSFANVYTITQFDNSYANVYTIIQVDNSFAYKHIFDASYNALAIGGGSTSSIDLSLVSSNIIPLTTNNVSLGSTSKYWNNAYINNLRLSNRAYQEISGDISWSAVNGYYGLTKDAYPSLNPYSSGDKAVQTWTVRTSSNDNNGWWGVCWSPELGIFVAVCNGGTNQAMTSPDGITWTGRTPPSGSNEVCWSPELRIFVAITNEGVITSPDGINWTFRQPPTGNWFSVCWSPELGIFVAVTINGDATYPIMTSNNGKDWYGRTTSNEPPNLWLSICWSKELGLFAVVGSGKVMTSSDGITWTIRTTPYGTTGRGVCWSGELGIFVAVGIGGTYKVMTSPDGINWTGRTSSNDNNGWYGVCWCKELRLFVAVAQYDTNRLMTSPDGINWTGRTTPNEAYNLRTICWSKELGIFVVVAHGGSKKILTSSLKCRPPTSYNVFDVSAGVTLSISTNVGGTIVFTTVGSSTFTPSMSGNVEVLIVAGGGGGGRSIGGGGGGGGVIYMPSVSVSAGTNYPIFVGNGGASSTNGQNSTAFGAVAAGGGSSGEWARGFGLAGGSGGGAAAQDAANRGGDSTGNSLGPNSGFIYGNRGGHMTTDRQDTPLRGAGGGGAGGQGLDTNTNNTVDTGQTGMGSGGVGIVNSILGPSYYWAGGGGGGGFGGAGGWGGLGGGGGGQGEIGAVGGGSALNNGFNGNNGAGNGGTNTGGGGGGATLFATGGNGGSGIVVIRYLPTATVNLSSNSIDETGKWSFANIAVPTLNVTSSFTNSSDDRLKHNEVAITNGLTIIDQLNPKFYQKTQTLLDASYNGDLSGHAWTYEAGLIAQELLQIPELSFVVGGGDYYQLNYILRSQLNAPIYPRIYYEQKWNYDLSFAISYYQQKMNTDLSFDVSYNTLQILSDLRLDASYSILKMNNDLIFDACYNEQKSNNDLSYQDLSINDLSYSYYYELSNNIIAQPYTLNYNSIFVYGLAAIKELHAKVKAQDLSLLTQQTIINSLTTKMQALETNPNNS